VGLNKHAPSCQRPWYVEGGGVVQALGLYQTEGLRPSFNSLMTLEVLDRAAGNATCQILSVAGQGLVGSAVVPLWPAPYKLGAFTLGALSILAANYLCPEMEVGGQDPNLRSGCQYTPNGGFPKKYQPSGEGGAGFSYCEWVEITDIETRASSEGPEFMEAKLSALHVEGYIAKTSPEWQLVEKGTTFGMSPCNGDECGGDDNGTPMPPADAFDPITYTDPETNCTYITKLLGFVEPFEGGPTSPVFSISGGGDQLKADGGRIGGCNFDPVIYYPGPGGGGSGGGGGGGGDDPIVIPWPGGGGGGGGGEPGGGGGGDWIGPLLSALGGAGGAIIGDLLMDLVQSQYPGLIYRMVSVCEKDASGEPISEAVEVPIPMLPAPDAQLARLDAIVELLQASKNFKQPICGDETPEPEGEFRTISFRSTEVSPYGNSRLRKRLRYRSVTGLGLDALVDHWKDFQWEAGPIRVRHIGSSWGAPEVWAASEDEGKRVLRHAAGEAGINPDQVGRWTTRRSNSSRRGVSGTMNVDTTGGYYWITERDGSSNRPTVALTSD